MAPFRRLIREIHRRSLWQVVGIYAAGSWVAYEVVLSLVEGLGLPDWVAPMAIVLFVIGLPIVLATAFIQEGLPGQAGAADRAPAEAATRATPAEAATLPAAPDPSRSGPVKAPGTSWLFTWRGAMTGGVLAFAALGLSVTGFMGMRTLGIGPAGSLVGKGVLAESDHILVAEFNPLTGDSAIASVVSEAMRVDLSQSELLNVVDRSRIRSALDRMSQSDTVRLGSELAREVAFRLGLKAVVEGEVGGAAGSYLLSARLVTPDSGRVLATFRETAADSTELLPAVDRLSRKLRAKAGESLRTIRANPPLTQVTTSSLPALRKYVLAREEEGAGRRGRAMQLMEEAVALDPEFASAHRSLAVYMWNSGYRGDSLFHHIQEAVRLGDRLTDYERHHARGFAAVASYDLLAARREYEALLAMDSTDHAALINLGVVYSLLNEKERALEMATQAYEAGDRTVNQTYWNIVQNHLNLGRLDETDEVIGRAAADHPGSRTVPLMRWLVAMARHDDDAADSAVRELVAVAGASDGAAGWLGFLQALQQGRLAAALEARPLDRTFQDSLVTSLTTAYIELFIRGRPARAASGVRTALQRAATQKAALSDLPYPDAALILALAGRSEAARDLIRRFRDGVRPELLGQHESLLLAAEGIADVVDGDHETGLDLLRQVRRQASCDACGEALAGRAFELASSPDSAIAAYERYLQGHWADRHLFPGRGEPPNDPFIRAYLHERLAALYDDAGDVDNARLHYAALVEQWRDADPELQPRVRAAQRRLETLLAEGAGTS